jgi:hypothetical protein
MPENVVSAISCGGYAGATAIQCCLRQWFVTAIEVGDQGLVIGSLAGSAFEEKAGFVRTAQIAQEHGVVNFHRRLQAGLELEGRRGGGTNAYSRSPDCAVTPERAFSTSAGASLALSTHRDLGQYTTFSLLHRFPPRSSKPSAKSSTKSRRDKRRSLRPETLCDRELILEAATELRLILMQPGIE